MTPREFDNLRETPDRARLETLSPERRFQILMSLRHFDDAWQEIKDCESQLGWALKCQWYVYRRSPSKVQACLSKRIPGADLEALTHFDNWQGWLYSELGEKEKAVKCLEVALYNAEVNLGLPYLAKTIRHNLASFTGETVDIETSNPELAREHMLSTFQTLLREREYGRIYKSEYQAELKAFVRAVEAKDKLQFASVFEFSRKMIMLPSEDLEILKNFLYIDLAGRVKNHRPEIDVKDCLKALDILLKATWSRLETLQNAAKLFPLGVELAQRKMDIRLYDIPIVMSHGVYIGGEKLFKPLPVVYKGMVRDELNNEDYHFKSMTYRSARHLLNSNLKQNNLTRLNVITDELIKQAMSYLT